MVFVAVVLKASDAVERMRCQDRYEVMYEVMYEVFYSAGKFLLPNLQSYKPLNTFCK